MATYQICAAASGIGALADVKTILTVSKADPHPAPFQSYAELVGRDLNNAPIPQGLPTCKWQWDFLPSADYDVLKALVGSVYIQTQNNTNSSGKFGFAKYLATMAEETPPEPREGNLRDRVVFTFTMLVLQP